MDVPEYIAKFYLEHVVPGSNSVSLYADLISSLPDDTPKPSLNDWLYYYNILKLQKIVTSTGEFLDEMQSKLKRLKESKSSDVIEVRELERSIPLTEQRYVKSIGLLMHHLDNSIERSTPKKLEIESRHTINIQQMNDFLNKNLKDLPRIESEIVDAEFQLKD